jgi:hypothetical protein
VGGVDLSGDLNLGASFTNVPGGTANWTFTGGTNYNDQSGAAAIVINKANATVTANNKSKTYGDLNPALDAAVAGQVSGGDAVNYSLATAATQYSGVGPYAITVTLGANPNYDVTPFDGALTVNKAAATVTANDKAKTYGAANPALDAMVAGQVSGGDAVNYTLATAATQYSSVAGGPYPITVMMGSNPNYEVTPNHGALTVYPATTTIVLNDLVKAYTGSILQPTVTTVATSYSLVFNPAGSPKDVGVYSVVATTTDTNYLPATDTALFVIYDPNGGFVTGGGWINSPVGSCEFAACTSQTIGKASFGFNSKYQKGKTVPTGETEFQFQAGSLNFKSTDYDWLVVSGTTKAQFKGSGKINGTGNYEFILTAIDGDNFGNKKADSFRIKIVDKNDNKIVYDNRRDSPDNSDDATILGNNGQGGGSIVIHEGKK